MHPTVRQQWYNLNAPIEGATPFLYLDTKGLVTTALGLMLPNIAAAEKLPWVNPDGTPATPEAIDAAFRTVHAMPAGRTASYYASATTIRLTQGAMEASALATLDEYAGDLAGRFPPFGDWPAAAQFATCSMAWALGPWFHWQHWQAAVEAQDWATAAIECVFAHPVGTQVQRQRMNVAMFQFAAAGGDAEGLPGGDTPQSPSTAASVAPIGESVADRLMDAELAEIAGHN